MNATVLLALEVFSVLCNLMFIILLIQRKSVSWLYGIVGSLSGAVLFYFSQYYAETGLYLFYALIGFYGWYVWTRPEQNKKIKVLPSYIHAIVIAIGATCTVVIGQMLSATDADKPFYDAFSSVFGVFATFLELHKCLGGWIYWILLNLFSIWLYASKGIWIYAGLMVLYTALSVKGYLQWRAAYRESN